MTVNVGPTNWWWLSSPNAPINCHYKAVARCCGTSCVTRDGGILICKANGVAWFVAPCCTQVGQTWNGTTTCLVGDKPNVTDWPTLCARMVSCGFNPSDWFVPSTTQLNNPGYVCRTQWDPTSARYWSSTEITAAGACRQCFSNGNISTILKTGALCVRAFRCVTY